MFVAVISAKRTENVGDMAEKIGLATWFVPSEDAAEYESQCALYGGEVVDSGPFPNLCRSRNMALDAAFADGYHCFQTDDDLKKVRHVFAEGHVNEMSFDGMVTLMADRLQSSPYKLAGVMPAANPFWSRKPVKNDVFIIGSCMMVAPSELRHDEALPLKEDYDFTLQHVQEFGGVVRSDDIIAEYQHYTNKGGAVHQRNTRREREAISRLQGKWGNAVKENPRRKNEVLIFPRKLHGRVL